MKAYRVQVIHQVTEVYRVEADSREDAWHRVERAMDSPLSEDAQQSVRLEVTSHGKREVWDIRRDVEDHAELPKRTVDDTLGECTTCGTSALECFQRFQRDGTSWCCGRCQHPGQPFRPPEF